MLTTFVSVKGAPGVTTLACLVGATWPEQRRVAVVEADPFGGDLAARFQLSSAWGWASYVTAARRSEGVVPIEPHLQPLPGGLEVMVLPQGDRSLVSARSVEALLRSSVTTESGSAEPEPAWWGARDLVVDGGRLTGLGPQSGSTSSGSSNGIWIDRSHRVVVVTRRDPASLFKVRERTADLRERCGSRVGLVVVGRGPHETAAIEEFTGIAVIGVVPHDPKAAHIASGERVGGRQLSRSLLVVSAHRLAQALAGTAAAGAGTGAGNQEGSVPSDRTTGAVGLPEARGQRTVGFLRYVRRRAADGRVTGPSATGTITDPMPDPEPELAPDGHRPEEAAAGPSQAVAG